MGILNDPRETDLFGNPVRARKGLRGRPSVELTAKDLDMLEAAQAKGWTNVRIAEVLGIGLSTLKRNFGPILSGAKRAPDRLVLALSATAIRQALDGDMAAMRMVRQMLADDRALDADAKFRGARGDEEYSEPPAPRLGKKELARIEAEQVGGEGSLWADDLNPGFGRRH